MAGTSSEMQRHADEPTGALLIMLEHDTRMVAKEKQEEEDREMRKRSEELTPAYEVPVMNEADTREHAVLLQAKLAKLRMKNNKAAEEAELKQRALLDIQGKLAKKKTAKNEEAGKAQACETEAKKAQACETEAKKAQACETEARNAEGSARRAIQKRREERTKPLLGSLEKSIEKEEKKNQRTKALLESLEKSIQEEKKKKKKPKPKAKEKDKEAGKAEASVTQTVTEIGKPEEAELEQRAFLITQEKLANKKAKDEEAEAREAQAYLTEVKAYLAEVEAYVTGAEKYVKEASKTAEDAAAKTSDVMPVFEDAEDFGAEFESFWNTHFRRHCAYDETTTIPAMCYTHRSDCDVSTMDTLQVISIKVASIKEGLSWPLQVFGTVSARDVVDRKRNIIFHRERDNCQTITDQDPYVTLTGPSRAVVVDGDPSHIEVVLKVKGDTESEDKELSRIAAIYRLSCEISGLYPSELSTLELRLGLVPDSVEATVHVKVTGGSWPNGFKGVFSAANARNQFVKVKLLDIRDDGLPVDAADGMIRLSRRVVSVELRGMLKLFVSAYSPAGDEECCVASFVPAEAGFSSGVELQIGSCRMEATVAWSLFCDDY